MLADNPLGFTVLLKSVSHYSFMLRRRRDLSLEIESLPVDKYRDSDRFFAVEIEDFESSLW